MKSLPLIGSIVIAVIVIGGAVLFGQRDTAPIVAGIRSNVSVTAGTQVIDIVARGGYAPKLTTAKADMPTVLRVKTEGTYDCSSAIRIPSLGYSKTMEATGITEITVPPQKAGSTLQGVCAMGMYSFQVQFET